MTNRIYRDWNESSIKQEGQTYHLVNDGILSRKDFSILFQNDDGKHHIPVEVTDCLNVYSNVSISSGLMDLLGRKKIRINVFDFNGVYKGSYSGKSCDGSVALLLKQSEIYLNDEKRLNMAKTIIQGGIANILSNLKYYRKTLSNEIVIELAIEEIGRIRAKINDAKTVNEIMIWEAKARQNYYSTFDTIIKKSNFTFLSRTKRPPLNEFNAMISFGNTLMYNQVAMEIAKSNLDIRISYLHAASTRKENLHLDLSEIFKPVIVDKLNFALANKRILRKEHFEKVDIGGIYLNEEGRNIYIENWEKKLDQVICYQGKNTTYRKIIRAEIRKFQQCIRKETNYKPYKYY